MTLTVSILKIFQVVFVGCLELFEYLSWRKKNTRGKNKEPSWFRNTRIRKSDSSSEITLVEMRTLSELVGIFFRAIVRPMLTLIYGCILSVAL